MIGALLVAAGESKRMGEPKLVLPWKTGVSLIQYVIQIYQQSGIEDIYVVTGGYRQCIEADLKNFPVKLIFNPDFRTGEMISSIRVGLTALKQTDLQATFIAPADLPFLMAETIEAMRDNWLTSQPEILAPSYEMKRGHPMLVARSQWDPIIELEEAKTLRDHFRMLADIIEYIHVDDPGILRDVDTPADYDEVSRNV